MAEDAPRKVGQYARPARGKGLLIGGIILLALIVLAIVLFSSRRAGAAALGPGGSYAASARDSRPWPGWVVGDRVRVPAP